MHVGILILLVGFLAAGCKEATPSHANATNVAYSNESLENVATVNAAIDVLLARIKTLEAALAQANQDLESHDLRIKIARDKAGDNESAIAALTASLSTVAGQLADAELASRVSALENKTAAMSFAEVDDHNAIIFTGVNVHIRNGASEGHNGFLTQSTNGLGNLIVGYNEGTASVVRGGSHNIVVGRQHHYSSYGGLVVGYGNRILAPYASVTGGTSNQATGSYSSVSGGSTNYATNHNSSVCGGLSNSANGGSSTVSGGRENTAEAMYSSVSGGYQVSVGTAGSWAAGTQVYNHPE